MRQGGSQNPGRARDPEAVPGVEKRMTGKETSKPRKRAPAPKKQRGRQQMNRYILLALMLLGGAQSPAEARRL